MKKLIFPLLFIAVSSFGQVDDAHFWSGFGLDLDITKKFNVAVESQVRFDQNASAFNQAYFELGGDYKILKGLKAGLIYRYARKNDGDYYFNQNRFCLDLSYRYKLDMGLSFKTRARFQHAFDRFSEVNGIYPNRKNIYRQAFKISYTNKDFKLVSPFIGAELFYALQPLNSTSTLDTYRLKGGLSFDLPKRQSLKVFYTYEYENRTVDNKNHIYGIQYGYSFKALYKNKKGKKSDTKKSEPKP